MVYSGNVGFGPDSPTLSWVSGVLSPVPGSINCCLFWSCVPFTGRNDVFGVLAVFCLLGLLSRACVTPPSTRTVKSTYVFLTSMI